MRIKEIGMEHGFYVMIAASWAIAAGAVYWAIKDKK